jgi:hypothetical protein
MTATESIAHGTDGAPGAGDTGYQVIVDPAGQLEGIRNKLSPRSPDILKDSVIGVLHNSKPNGDLLMEFVVEWLIKEHGVKDVVRVRKQTPGIGVNEEQIAALSGCAVILNGTGDCGNCTSWTVHDTVTLERLGFPTVMFGTHEFTYLAHLESESLGLGALSRVVVPHPINAQPREAIAAKAEAVREQVLRFLTTPAEQLSAEHYETCQLSVVDAHEKSAAQISVGSSYEALAGYLDEAGLGDGLPVVAPTPSRVERMLQWTDRDPHEVIARIMPNGAAATVEKIAANAVMAGCKPMYLPLVIAGVQAMTQPAFNLLGVQATTHTVAPLMVVSGPLAEQVGLNSGAGLFGPGFQANATIGRAIRMILLNIGGARPGLLDKSTMGQPGKFSYCIAENHARSPWEPLHVERGLPEGASMIAMVPGEGPHTVHDNQSTTGEGLLHVICGSIAQTGSNNSVFDADFLVVIGPEHAATMARDGFSKRDVQEYIFNNARIPLSKWSTEYVQGLFRDKYPDRYGDVDAETTLARFAPDPESVIVIVAGGPGKFTMHVPTMGAMPTVFEPIRLKSGELAMSLDDFRRS